MDIQDYWEKALARTEIIRSRVQPLATFADTQLPYIMLSESAVNLGDTVVRKGEVSVEKPAIVLPCNMPFFEGFDFEEGMQVNEDLLRSFFLVRGISFPSFKYNNKTSSVHVHDGKLSNAIEHYSRALAQDENVHAGLVMGPEDCWQFSVIIFACGQVARSADTDIRRLMDNRGFNNLS